MKTFACIVAASLAALAAGAEAGLRGARELYPATFGGWAYAGPALHQPVNACYNFDRNAPADGGMFTDCDGTAAANAYCVGRGYSHATTFKVEALHDAGSTWVEGSGQVVEAGIGPKQYAIKDVTCE